MAKFSHQIHNPHSPAMFIGSNIMSTNSVGLLA